jgi:methylmalonyl-CoA mutase
MMTKRDPHVNMLRTTVAAFSAALGGADAITVLPFTAALGLPDAFARRIARNTQLLLLEEAHLAKVSDPGAGSGAIEDLTQQLCAAAWSLFQEIERAGGAAAALESSLIQHKVAAVRAEREHAIAHRIDVLTGTTEFPNMAEAPVSVLDVAPLSSAPSPAAGSFASMPRMRLAEPFERLRDASDRLLADRGSRPKVFLANLGRPSDFSARASFARNFFEAGGIETVTNDGFASREALLDALRASGARLMCLCSSDKIYATEATDVARAASAVPGIHVCLAGRPRESEAALRDAGVETFIHAGCDALATLRGLYHLTQ